MFTITAHPGVTITVHHGVTITVDPGVKVIMHINQIELK